MFHNIIYILETNIGKEVIVFLSKAKVGLCKTCDCLIEVVTKSNKSNTECGIIRPTNAIYMGSNSLLGSKALSKL